MSEGVEITTEERPGQPFVREKRPDPCTLVLFGATGDLAQRKLLPGLYNLARDGWLPESFGVIAFSRSSKDADAFRKKAREAVGKYSRTQPIDEAIWNRFAEKIECVPGAFDDAAAFQQLREKLAEVDKRRGTKGNHLFYMATPASAFAPILAQLSASRLIAKAPDARPWTRVIIEKPFGHDLQSAKELNALLAETLDESQVYRIDHYLGKETVQNILVFRFGNAIWEPLWNRNHIDHVEITAAEEIGIEGRGKFYDETGVLRDMIQNHLLQVLALIAMEPPVSFDGENIRDEKTKLIKALRPIVGGEVASEVVRGQYHGFREEEGVSRDSQTPTFVALRIMIDNWRWQGVPIYMRAGKNLAKRATEVSIHFKAVPFCLFGSEEACQRLEPNVLTLRIQPRDGIALKFECKVPGEDLEVAGVNMDFSYAAGFQKQPQEAYERLLLDCMRGNPTLFSRRDQVEEAWRFVTPILEAWEAGVGGPVASYEPKSEGPAEANALPRHDGRRWTRLT